jgi:fatty acid desaturase
MKLWFMWMMAFKKYWRIWAKAMGEKASKENREADKVAFIRTVIVLINCVCAIFIMTNIVHGWA